MRRGSTNSKRSSRKGSNETSTNGSRAMGIVIDMGWNAQGDTLAIGGKTIKLRNFISSGLGPPRVLCSLEPETIQLKFLDENIFGVLNEQALSIWDLRSHSSLAANTLKIDNNQTPLLTFDWNIEKQVASVLDLNSSISTLDFRKQAKEGLIKTYKSPANIQLTSVAWDPSGSVMFYAGAEEEGEKNGHLAMLTLSMEVIANFKCHCGGVTQLEMGKSGGRLITVGSDSIIQVHALADVICESAISLPEQIDFLGQCRLNREENFLAVSHDRKVSVYNLSRGNKIEAENVFQEPSLLAWHPHPNILTVCQKSGDYGVQILKV